MAKMWSIRFLGIAFLLAMGGGSGALAERGDFDKLSLMPVQGENYVYGYVWSVDWGKREITLSSVTLSMGDAVKVFDASGRPLEPTDLKLNLEAALKLEPDASGQQQRVTEIHIGKQPPSWLVPAKLRYNRY